MKQIIGKLQLLGLLTILIVVVFSLLLQVSAAPGRTATEEQIMETTTASPSVSMDFKKRSEYVLPYPGILHSHPLYFLKELRDKIIETLIVDPVRKSDFYLLQSDKWLASVPLLLSSQQIDLAGRVLHQAADRMGMAVTQLANLKKDGRLIPPGSLEKIHSAIEKHLEVVDELSVEKKISTDQARASYLATQEELMKLK